MNLSFIISSIGKSGKLDNLINQINAWFENKEIILVDNSQDKVLYEKYFNSDKCKYVYEEKSGLSFARNRGAMEAIYDMLIFLDDDVVLGDDFKSADFKLLYDDCHFGIAGGKIVVSEIPNYLPEKYTYLAGEKDYGDEVIVMPKYKYLGGCTLVIRKDVFNKLGAFDVNFGHNSNNIGANEDVIMQEMVRKKGLKVIYDPRLLVYHFWNEKEDKAILRVRKQGVVDRITDKKYFTFRMILRLIKYNIFIMINGNKNNLPSEKKYDLERYRSYVKGK